MISNCTICGKPIRAKGLCGQHYEMKRRTGSPHTVPFCSMRKPIPELSEILARCITVNGCWEWMGARIPDGYGVLQRNNEHWLVHRLVYTLLHGPIPEGMKVCHTCDRPPCCKPMHLFLGTQSDNAKDMVAKGRNFVPERDASGKFKRSL